MGAPESTAEFSGSSPRAMASRWYIQLSRDTVSSDLNAEFQRWLQEDPAHRAAYESVTQTWVSAAAVGDHPNILALRHQMALRLTRRNGWWSRASFRVAAAAAVVAVAVAVGMALDVQGWMSGKGRYSTSIGERIAIALADQSQMTLNTQTRIKTKFSDDERRVIVNEGQALFEVARDPRRPFIVEAAGREFIAVGTAFDVKIDGERVQVTMVEGSVKVPAREGGQDGVLIKAGDQLTVDRASPDPAPRAIGSAGVDRATSWRRGQLMFEETPLSEAIAEMNRYSEQKISLASPELGNLKVSGAFSTGEMHAFAEAVMVYIPLEVSREDRRGIVLRARQ